MSASRATTLLFFFFNDTATTEIYTLSLHDALPISPAKQAIANTGLALIPGSDGVLRDAAHARSIAREVGFPVLLKRSEEHTSELQSLAYLVCRLLLEKKKKKQQKISIRHTKILVCV